MVCISCTQKYIKHVFVCEGIKRKNVAEKR